MFNVKSYCQNITRGVNRLTLDNRCDPPRVDSRLDRLSQGGTFKGARLKSSTLRESTQARVYPGGAATIVIPVEQARR